MNGRDTFKTHAIYKCVFTLLSTHITYLNDSSFFLTFRTSKTELEAQLYFRFFITLRLFISKVTLTGATGSEEDASLTFNLACQ